ncbi:uncharacterized protein [Palaemon carinicauda]|uniref:uncharacterized protein n=1 Tax=Palaemon carinicauda TaxID=392227 RepID=UPI0035B6A3C7
MFSSLLDTEQSPKMHPTIAENQAKPSEKSFMCKIPLYPQTTERLFGPLIKQPPVMKTDMCEIILNPKCQETPSHPTRRGKAPRKEEPVNCAYCGARFLKRKYLKCHIQLRRCRGFDSAIGKYVTDFKSKEPNKKNVICADCGTVFLKKKYLDQHLKRKSCKRMRYFKRKRQAVLQREKKYHCTVCRKGFTYQKSFYRHQSICPKPSNVQDNSSEIVSEAFNERVSNVNEDQALHSEIIEKRKELEMENMGVPTNKKTFNNLACEPVSLRDISNKKTNLETRKKTRYQCSVCSKGFIYVKNFERHQNLLCNVSYKRSKDQKIKGKVSAPAKNEVPSVEHGLALRCETENLVESANRPVVGGDCEMASVDASLEKEADCVKEKISFHCSVCDKDFYDQKNLERHQSVSGSICYKASEVEEHPKRVSEKGVSEFIKWISRLHKKEPSRGNIYRCFICTAGYIYKKNLIRHIKRSRCKRIYLNIISAETLSEELGNMALEMNRCLPLDECYLPKQGQKVCNIVANRRACCPFCFKVFSTKSNLYKHCRMRRCRFELSMESLKQKQVRRRMRGVKNVPARSTKVNCPDCGVLYRKTKYFNQHIKLNRCKRATDIPAEQAQGVSHTSINDENVNQAGQKEPHEIEALLDLVKDESRDANSSCILDAQSECETSSVAEDIVKEEIDEIPPFSNHEQIEFTQEQIELLVSVKEETDEFLGSFMEEEEEGSQNQPVESGFPADVIEEETGEVLWPPLIERANRIEYDGVCDAEATAGDEKKYEAYRLQEYNLSGQEWASGINGEVLALHNPENKLKNRMRQMCYHCGQSFVSTSNLNKHFKMNRCRPYRQFLRSTRWLDPVGCRDCGNQYLRFKYFLQHKKLNRCIALREKHCLAPAETEKSAKAAFGKVCNVWDLISLEDIHTEESNVLSCKSSNSTGKELEPDTSNTRPWNNNASLLESPLSMSDQVTTGIINTSSDNVGNEDLENSELITEDEAIAPSPSGKSKEPHHSQVDVGAKFIPPEENLNLFQQEQEVTSVLQTVSQATEPKRNESQAAEPERNESQAAEPKRNESQAAEPERNESQAAELERNESQAAEPERNESHVAEPERNESQAAEPKRNESQAAEPERNESQAAEPERNESQAAELDRNESQAAELERNESQAAELERNESQAAEPDRNESQAAEPERNESQVAEPERNESQAAEPERNRSQASKADESKSNRSQGCEAEDETSSARKPKKVRSQGTESGGRKNQQCKPSQSDHVKINHVGVESPELTIKAEPGNAGDSPFDVSKQLKSSLKNSSHEKAGRPRLPLNCRHCGKHFFSRSNLNRHLKHVKCQTGLRYIRIKGDASIMILGKLRANEPVTCADCGVRFRKKKYMVVHKKLKRCKMYFNHESMKENSLRVGLTSNNENTPDLHISDVANRKSSARKNHTKHKASRKGSVHLRKEKYLTGPGKRDVCGAVPVNQHPLEILVEKKSNTLIDDLELDKGIDVQFKTNLNSNSKNGKEFKVDPDDNCIPKEENPLHDQQNGYYENTNPNKGVTCADCGAPFLRKKYLVAHKKLNRCRMSASRARKNRSLRVARKNKLLPVAPENRSLPVAPENKLLPVASENRSLPVTPENKLLPVAPENRSLPVASKNKLLPVAPGNRSLPVAPKNKLLPVALENKSLPVSPKRKLLPVAPENRSLLVAPKNKLSPDAPKNRSLPVTPENRLLPVTPGCSKKKASSSGYSSDESFQHFLAINSPKNIPLKTWSDVKKLEIMGEKHYECKYCTKGFHYQRNLHRHLKLGRCKAALKCPFCDECFFHKTTMAEHLQYELQNMQNQIHSKNEKGNELTDGSCREASSRREENKVHSIKENSLPLKQGPDLENERTCVDGESQNVNTWGNEEIRESLGGNQISTVNLICPLCRECFSSQGELMHHMKEHSSVKKLKCSVCNGKFCNRFVLDCHMKICHSDRDCLCKMCNKDLKGYKDLELFLPENGNGQPYECPLCDKNFCRYRNMLRHVRIHLRRCRKKNNNVSKL